MDPPLRIDLKTHCTMSECFYHRAVLILYVCVCLHVCVRTYVCVFMCELFTFFSNLIIKVLCLSVMSNNDIYFGRFVLSPSLQSILKKKIIIISLHAFFSKN